MPFKSKTPLLVTPVLLPERLPELPAPPAKFLHHVQANPGVPVRKLLEPFIEYETALRAYFAQAPDHQFVKGDVNLVSLFEDGNDSLLKIRGRKLDEESPEEQKRYVMPLSEKDRKSDGEPALVSSFGDFKKNFAIFSEGALMNLDWSHVVAAGSSVLTPLLRVPKEKGKSVRLLREYYHDHLAPASDIDLFIHGIEDPQEGIKKMAAIENTIKDNLIWETTTVRTKNTITIVSQYPNRHVQIVLRLYKSISQILTGFDVNCACVAYDGTRILAVPRAIAAAMTQCNDIDLTRRSPSYENRLAKYSRRGFEVYCSFLDRSRLDPTIYERAFNRTVGLARLLVLEALPEPKKREAYVRQRKEEMGRPVNPFPSYRIRNQGNKKEGADEDLAEWNFEDVSNYEKFSIPYGPSFNAKKIERLFIKRDLLLNAEWNPQNNPPHRTVHLHRHPVFLGTVEGVAVDCCGFCPEPLNDEEKKIQEEEDVMYIRGDLKFLKDDPGRQEIGSFYPLGPEDYTEMAYVGTTERFCQAIVKNDLEFVKSWCATEEGKADINCRDFCGRAPLHLAVMSEGILSEIVQVLIDTGARLIARIQDGRTALHIAAGKGRVDIIASLLKKSEENEHERGLREEKRRAAQSSQTRDADVDGDENMSESIHSHSDLSGEEYEYMVVGTGSITAKTATDSSYVGVKKGEEVEGFVEGVVDEDEDQDDIYDINVVDWDYQMTPLHHAIVRGHCNAVELLVSDFGADPLIPMKIFERTYGTKVPRAAVLVLALVYQLPIEKQAEMTATLLRVGAKTSQADNFSKATGLLRAVANDSMPILETMFELDGPGAMSVLNKVSTYNFQSDVSTPLITALMKVGETRSLDVANYLLDKGATGYVKFDDFQHCFPTRQASLYNRNHVYNKIRQPIEIAIEYEYACALVPRLLKAGADPSALASSTASHWSFIIDKEPLQFQGETVLDLVRKNIEAYRNFLKPVESKPAAAVGIQEPIPVSFLDSFPEGSWERFTAEFARKRENMAREVGSGGRGQCMGIRARRMADAKRENVEKLLRLFEEAEKALLEAGAKTFKELYPDRIPVHPAAQSQLTHATHYNFGGALFGSGATPVDFKVPFRISIPCEGATLERYSKLFNAVWKGDQETVKILTTGPSGEPSMPALQISVSSRGWTTLWIAIYRNDYAMARLILEIVKSQYEEPSKKQARGAVKIDIPGDSDDDSEHYFQDTVDHDFTIEDSGAVSDFIRCNISPYNFISQGSPPLKELLGEEEEATLEKQNRLRWLEGAWSILSLAIYKDDPELFEFILLAVEEFGGPKAVQKYVQPFDGMWRHQSCAHVRLALALGRIWVLEELMKRYTFGIHYDSLRKKDDGIRNAKPKYYRGLVVHGTRTQIHNPYENSSPETKDIQKPLQVAAYFGNLDSIKWLLSDRPWRCLDSFTDLNPKKKHVKLLKNQGDALPKIFRESLGLDNINLPHICLLAWAGPDPMEVFRFLVSRPGSLDSRNSDGLTPALFAVAHRRIDAIKYLRREDVAADFSTRDFKGRNVLHLTFARHVGQDVSKTEEIMKLLPQDKLADMFLQRTRHLGRTPLAEFLTLPTYPGAQLFVTMMETLLKYSKGIEIGLFDSEGNLPIHTLFRRNLVQSSRILLALKPEHINAENASGRTPLEIATSNFLTKISEKAEPLQIPRYWRKVLDSSPTEFLTAEDRAAAAAAEGRQVPEKKEEVWDRSNIESAFELACKVAKETECGRALVNLVEARSLVQRLQGSKDMPVSEEEEVVYKRERELQGQFDPMWAVL